MDGGELLMEQRQMTKRKVSMFWKRKRCRTSSGSSFEDFGSNPEIHDSAVEAGIEVSANPETISAPTMESLEDSAIRSPQVGQPPPINRIRELSYQDAFLLLH